MQEANIVKEVDIFQLEDLINKNEMVVVDFWATWCAPCHAFAKVFEKLATEEPVLTFVKMNIGEASQEVLDSLGVSSVPHLMIFKKGVAIYSEAGSMPYSVLRDLIEQTKQLTDV